MTEATWGERRQETARRRLRWRDWGLLAYVLLLAAIGVTVLRLAANHRRFDRLTVIPTGARSAD